MPVHKQTLRTALQDRQVEFENFKSKTAKLEIAGREAARERLLSAGLYDDITGLSINSKLKIALALEIAEEKSTALDAGEYADVKTTTAIEASKEVDSKEDEEVGSLREAINSLTKDVGSLTTRVKEMKQLVETFGKANFEAFKIVQESIRSFTKEADELKGKSRR